ncbi:MULTISPECIES: two-component system response regulator YvrH [Bacillus]|uniref:two-component system response regulator YvrH n=1 Tax=Bacillus TaxID=1386 RepID=UPI000D04012E|nr:MULTISPECIES: two-component system response regulator YvrH [Bacillus]MCP9297475.1 two-component system response regulator YvrH [Bacillus halotolerans]MCV0025972.1 two-component system response regulator YvrH [Bacillus sp. XT-2]PRS06667.1 DNA-binding response regulator [Bacillus halotolerans]PRS25882.1 DNA-binding response regulator [Bacillus halotolerans]QDK66767.1 response regulator transcription factor [Bacillus halotolerans]
MENASILIVDDEKAIVDMIKRVLEKEGYRHILDAASAEEAIPVVKTNKVDLIVLDVMMGGMSGFEACTLIREYSDAPIFFLTARSSDADKLSGFAVGADDYITKPFNPLELAARIRAHLKRTYQSNAAESNKTYTYDYFTFSPQNAELIVGGETVACSAQLLQLLQYFCEHPNVVLSKDQIYEKVWGYPSYGDNNTVMVHIRKLREKIERDPSNPEYIVTVRGLGYRFIPSPEGNGKRP